MTRAPPASRLDGAIDRIRAEGRVGLMTHIVLGYPSLAESRAIVDRMARAGADLIEVQIPFSDPTADGPVITRACQSALDGGVRVADLFRFLDEVIADHGRDGPPFLVMSYFNLAFAYRDARNGGRGGADGVRGFVAACAQAGASGLIVPDLPPEAVEEGYPEAAREHGVHPVYVISPNTGDARLRAVREVASGMVYATSRTGTTGREVELQRAALAGFLARARQACGLPLAVGFSISERAHVEALAGQAEVAVAGTHLIRAYEARGLDGVEEEVRRLAGR